MKKFFEEFKKFAIRGNVLDMAIGIIIGGAFTAIVTALTDSFIRPLLNIILTWSWGSLSFALIGSCFANFLSAVVNFVLTAFILFLLVKAIAAMSSIGKKKEEAPAPAPTTKKCPFCKSEIALDATRCPHCTSTLED